MTTDSMGVVLLEWQEEPTRKIAAETMAELVAMSPWLPEDDWAPTCSSEHDEELTSVDVWL